MKLSKDVDIAAKDVTSVLKKSVYPLLKEHGFDDWTGRKAWRRQGERIDTFEFRGFNDYRAARHECTTASLTIWFGTSLPELPFKFDAKEGKKGPRPDEAQMPIRGDLAPSQDFRKVTRDSNSIWVIENERDAQLAAFDIKKQLHDHGLAWINRKYNAQELREFLRNENAFPVLERIGHSRLYVDGGNGLCPARFKMLAELSASLRDYRNAAEYFEKARWAKNRKTGEMKLLYEDTPEEDKRLAMLAVKYAQMAT